MTTLLTTCITNLNQKLKNPKRKNLTQLDAHGSSGQCCHYIKIKLRFYHHHMFEQSTFLDSQVLLIEPQLI